MTAWNVILSPPVYRGSEESGHVVRKAPELSGVPRDFAAGSFDSGFVLAQDDIWAIFASVLVLHSPFVRVFLSIVAPDGA